MFPEHSLHCTQCQAYNPGWEPAECPSCSIQGCDEFPCQGLSGVRGNRLSFKLDFFLFPINLSACPFPGAVTLKNQLKALDLRWLEAFLLKF